MTFLRVLRGQPLTTLVAVLNPGGTGLKLATVATLATLSLVLPSFTTSASGPEFTGSQLAFSAVCSLALYLLFVFVQTVRHRDDFLPAGRSGAILDDSGDEHAAPPSAAEAIGSLVLLLVALVDVVGLAKTESLAAVRAARRDIFGAFLFLAANP